MWLLRVHPQHEYVIYICLLSSRDGCALVCARVFLLSRNEHRLEAQMYRFYSPSTFIPSPSGRLARISDLYNYCEPPSLSIISSRVGTYVPLCVWCIYSLARSTVSAHRCTVCVCVVQCVCVCVCVSKHRCTVCVCKRPSVSIISSCVGTDVPLRVCVCSYSLATSTVSKHRCTVCVCVCV